MKTITLKTSTREVLVDITAQVRTAVRDSGVKNGLGLVFVPHTTAGITVNENADPDVKADLVAGLRRMVPDSLPWQHSEGNSPAHVKASLVGSSVHIMIKDGELELGTWQGVFFCEFDGPRERKVLIEVYGS